MDDGLRVSAGAPRHRPRQTLRDEVVERLGLAESVHVVPLADPGVANRAPRKATGRWLFFGRIKAKGLEYLIRAEPLLRCPMPRS